MKSLYGKLFSSASPVAKTVSADLKRLNSVRSGLGDEAVSYVLHGTSETVLSSLSAHGDTNVLDLTNPYYRKTSNSEINAARRTLFLEMSPFDWPLLARYAQVLLASVKTLPDFLVGSRGCPPAMRLALTMMQEAACAEILEGASRRLAARRRPAAASHPTQLTSDQLEEFANEFGGTLDQLFEMLYWSPSQFGVPHSDPLRHLVDLVPLIRAFPDAAIAGLARSPVEGRVAFNTELRIHGLVETAPYTDFVLKQTDDSEKTVRESAAAALKSCAFPVIKDAVTAQLAKGSVNGRALMVEYLRGQDPDAVRPILEAHRKTEKTARIIAAIDNALTVFDVQTNLHTAPQSPNGYDATDGSWVTIPPLRPLEKAPLVELSDKDRAFLRARHEAFNKKVEALNKKTDAFEKEHGKLGFFSRQPTIKFDLTSAIETALKGQVLSVGKRHIAKKFLVSEIGGWFEAHLAKMGDEQRLTVSLQLVNCVEWHREAPFHRVFLAYLETEGADLRAFDLLCQKTEVIFRFRSRGAPAKSVGQAGDLLRALLPVQEWLQDGVEDIADDALWPYAAENLEILDHALGIAATQDLELGLLPALVCLSKLPKTPMRYFGLLLEIATGERKFGKALAKSMLVDNADVDDRLISLLDDGRQTARANAAGWLAERKNTQAIDPIKARLKKEKSELARAALLSALKDLGSPIDDYVGPAVLLREADVGLKKAKFDKLDWLALDHLPAARFTSGAKVPPQVLRWWLFLGAKLRQPAGNAMFDIYLDQLQPDSAAALSSWILDSWIAFDTMTMTDEEAHIFAQENADQRFQAYVRWQPDYTREKAYAELFRDKCSEYLNSGAATKGILAFAARAPGQAIAEKVRQYIRHHGPRTSQATSLLDVLAHNADPASLQVIIATATRVRQKSLQSYAAKLVQAVAEARNWSTDELADRTIPAAGLGDDGTLALICGAEDKRYVASLDETLTLVLTNPDGKGVKALPAGTEDTTKAARKQLSASRKELKQVVSMQTVRLSEALCCQRVWPLQDWQRDFRDHPIMRLLTERVVWQGLDEQGAVVCVFRPTAEGDYTDVHDDDLDLDCHSVRLAHDALMPAKDASDWAQHLKDYEVKPLVEQFGRAVFQLGTGNQDDTQINDREGWVTDALTLRGIATRCGWEPAQVEVGGMIYEYRKSFDSVGLTALVEFTGSFVGDANNRIALQSLRFVNHSRRRTDPLKLSDVSPVLLSECWNDYHAMAAKAAYDPNWKDTVEW